MAATTTGLASYLGLPPDSADDLEIFLNAAVTKATGAGVPAFTNNAQYDMFIYSLAGMYYDNRSMSFSGSYQATAENNARKMINAFVLELRYQKDGDAS